MTMTDHTTRRADSSAIPVQRITIPALEVAGMAALGSVIAIHATELGGKVDEIAYIGAGYVALIAACLIAIVMLAVGDRRGWLVGGVTAGATLTGYILTRTTGLPGSTGDVGNWLETIAVWAMVSEIAVVVLAAIGLTTSRPEG